MIANMRALGVDTQNIDSSAEAYIRMWDMTTAAAWSAACW